MHNKSSFVNQYFDNVYVLNLEARTDRKAEMIQKLDQLGIYAEFVTAINGYNFQNTLEYETYLQRPIGSEGLMEFRLKRKMIENQGAMGCLKSYYAILMDAKNKGYRRVLCLEDDAVFHKDFEAKFHKATTIIPENWKLLFLGASQQLWCVPDGMSYPDEQKIAVDPEAPFYFPKRTAGTFAYAIDCSVFDMLLSEIRTVSSPIDERPIRKVMDTFPKECFVLNPNLIIADVTHSNIRGKRSQAKLANKLRWNMIEYDFPFPKKEHYKPKKKFEMQKLNYRHHRNILIEKHKSIFFILPKTGCSSLKTQLIQPLGMGGKDENLDRLHDPMHYPFPFADYDSLNTSYNDYLKFTIIRNPWDRLVSCFKDKIRTSDYNEKGFKNGVAMPLWQFGADFYGGMTFPAFVDAVCALPDAFAENHFRSQYYQIINSKGELLINYIGRFETLQSSMMEINERTGLNFSSDVHLNKRNPKKSFREYYKNKAMIEKVRQRFFADVELFGYQFDSDEVRPIGFIDEKWEAHFSQKAVLDVFLKEKEKALMNGQSAHRRHIFLLKLQGFIEEIREKFSFKK